MYKSNPTDSFEAIFQEAERNPAFWCERAKLEFTREVVEIMKAQNVSKSELASRLGVRARMVTRLPSGQNNLELSTLVRIAMALNCRFRGQLCPVEKDLVSQSSSKPENARAIS